MGRTLSPRTPVSSAPRSTPPRSPAATVDGSASAWIVRKRTDGIDRLRSHLSWPTDQLVQLAPGRLDSRLFRYTAPGLQVAGGTSNLPLRAIGTTPAAQAGATFLLTGHGRHLVDACTIGAGVALSWTPGTTFRGITPSGLRWVTVSAPMATVEDLLPAAPATGPGLVPPRHASMPLRVRNAVSALLHDVDAWGTPGSERIAPREAGRYTAQGSELLTWALRTCTPLPEPAMHDLNAAKVVRVAERYLERHLQADVYMRDVSMELGVPVRTLHDSFHVILGISPMRYLDILRAHVVLRALRSTEPGASTTVHEAEAQAGVRHAARFAARYRALFGENPTDTLRTARGGAGHPSPASAIVG